MKKELMLELLTYEPFGKFFPNEKTYISKILDEDEDKDYNQPMLHALFSGFHRYVQKGDFKDIDWLQQWISTYSPKSGRFYYPLMLKKICFFCIVRGNFNDNEFMRRINLPVNLIWKWNISPQFRKYAEEDTYSVIKIFRSGAKKPYIVSIIKKLYYEAGLQVSHSEQLEKEGRKVEKPMLFKKAVRQVKQSMTLNKLPTFVDVFAGTANVAASMGASKGFPPPIVNDFDPVMVCFVWAFVYCQEELRKRIVEFHNDLMKQDFKSTPWSHNESAYEKSIDPTNLYENPKRWDNPVTQWKLMEFQGFSKAMIEEGKMLAQRHQELVMRTRSSYLDVKKVIDFCDREDLRNNIDFNNLSPHPIDPIDIVLLEDVLDYAQAVFYYYSFPPSGKNGNVYYETIVNACSYFLYLSRLQVVDLYAFKSKNKAVKAQKLTELQLKASLLTLESIGHFSKHLRGAEFYCKEFQKILPDGPSNKIYYLDSPYFLTVGYDVDFFDDKHKAMLDILHKAEFKWIFSMQFNPSCRCKCTSTSDEAKRKNQDHIIKDYGAYYRGFYAPLEVDADQRTYVVPDASMEDEENLKRLKELFVILFDFVAVEKKWPEMKTKTREMLVVNFNCLPMIPLHDTAVVLPFELFLQCADAKYAGAKCADAKRADAKCPYAKCAYADRAYQDIVQKAIAWRKNNITSNYAGKAPV